MWAAGCAATTQPGDVDDVWSAMLAASPEVPAQEPAAQQWRLNEWELGAKTAYAERGPADLSTIRAQARREALEEAAKAVARWGREASTLAKKENRRWAGEKSGKLLVESARQIEASILALISQEPGND